jgi:hypothetical protein
VNNRLRSEMTDCNVTRLDTPHQIETTHCNGTPKDANNRLRSETTTLATKIKTVRP